MPGNFINPIKKNVADPWMVYWQGNYYFCGTEPDRVVVRKVRDFTELESTEGQVIWETVPGSDHALHAWAPELHYLDGEWFLYVSSTDSAFENHRVHVLRGNSQDPTHPFQYIGKIVRDEDGWGIDGTVLHCRGKRYFIWAAGENRTEVLKIAEMKSPWELTGPRVVISRPLFDWERVGCPINEGPAVLQHGGRTFLAYSACPTESPCYSVGLLELTGGDPLDTVAWKKYEKPFLSRSETVMGSGHNSFTISPSGKEVWCVFHVLEKESRPIQRSTWAKKVEFSEDGFPLSMRPDEPGQPVSLPE